MERLTHRYDDGFAEDEITYCNPSDPEGLYNILDLAKHSDDGDGSEVGLLLEISRHLAAYEDTGLTPQEIMDGKLLTGWIPVDERLPELGEPVLLFLDNSKEQKITTGMRYIVDGIVVDDERYNGEWCVGFDKLDPEFLIGKYVTHWMPLPQPPKGN